MCKHATYCCNGNVPEQNCTLQVGCLLVNQIKGGDLLLFTQADVEHRSSATIALNMINVSEHYTKCLKSFWRCLENARDHRDLWVFCKLMSVRQLHLLILLSVKHFCRLFVNKFSSVEQISNAFTNKQKCNSIEHLAQFFSKFWNKFSEIYRQEQKFNKKGFSVVRITNWELEKNQNLQNCIWARIYNPSWKKTKIAFSNSIKARRSYLDSRPKGGSLEVMMTMRMVRMVLTRPSVMEVSL